MSRAQAASRINPWREDDWDPYDPDEFDQDFGMLFRRAFPDAVAEYARLGRSIQKVLIEYDVKNEPRARTKVGRGRHRRDDGGTSPLRRK